MFLQFSNLAYPDILEAYQNKIRANKSGNNNSTSVAASGAGPVDVYETWYPPMRTTLSLLSKLYGVVEMAVFEDFARRAIGRRISLTFNATIFIQY